MKRKKKISFETEMAFLGAIIALLLTVTFAPVLTTIGEPAGMYNSAPQPTCEGTCTPMTTDCIAGTSLGTGTEAGCGNNQKCCTTCKDIDPKYECSELWQCKNIINTETCSNGLTCCEKR